MQTGTPPRGISDSLASLADVHHQVISAATFADLLHAVAQACAECQAWLQEVIVVHPEQDDRTWCFARHADAGGEKVEWRREVRGRATTFEPWFSETERFTPPPPWPETCRLIRTDRGERRMSLPIGKPAPAALFVIALGDESTDEGPARLAAVLMRELPAVLARCIPREALESDVALYQCVTSASRVIQSCRDRETGATVIADCLRRDFGFDIALLAIVEGPIRLLRGHTVSPAGAAQLGKIDFPLRTSLHPLAAIVGQGQPVHAAWAPPDDPRVEPLELNAPVWQPVWLPLVARGEPVGLLISFNLEHRGALCPGQLRALELLANHCALALETLRDSTETELEAVRDPLTNLFNRRHLDRVLEQEVRRYRRYGTPLALLMIDLNDFKAFNDEHGHLAGDEILCAASKLLLDNVRETDVVARYGGDEFVVLMPSATEDQARAATKRILSAVVARNRQLADQPHLQFSLTVGHHTATDDTAERVLEAADRVMYSHKQDGTRRRLLDQLVAPRGTPVGQHARLIFGLMKTLALRDPGHVPHARRVMGYSVRMCKRLGLGPTATEEIAMAAILHDLGKVAINSEILRRPGPLSRSEEMLVRSHPVVAADMLAEMTFLDQPLRIIRHHHERWDGRITGDRPGYPDGLMGETIPLGSRIIRIADMFDALTIERPHARAVGVARACEVLRHEAGKSLDPNLLAKCLPVFEELSGPLDPEHVDFPMGL